MSPQNTALLRTLQVYEIHYVPPGVSGISQGKWDVPRGIQCWYKIIEYVHMYTLVHVYAWGIYVYYGCILALIHKNP